MTDFEKLGMFFLGRKYSLADRKTTEELLMYDSKDLVTHGVCVGMTGSGKTGLCIGLLEEAAIDNIPALIIDPKGDIGNMLLTFPELRPDDFLPWINTDEAARDGITTEEYAGQQAELWKHGLVKWGQDGERIRRLRDAAEYTIFTPGSNSGIPLSILHSFAAPPANILEDRDAFGDLVATTTSSLLGLLGIKADPIKSREHILIANILNHYWHEGQNLDLTQIIRAIQSPPFDLVGAFALDSFYPEKERFGLALSLNNLLAAPTFAAWLEGESLDVGRLLYTEEGKPRVSIFSIAHLSEPERMFFVSLLLNQVVSWMRTQSGTTSLRAIIYMDEVYGYLPPVAAPPSKAPLMILLKQGRAFGMGVLLATQNPVDLDYKALSNAGTWFIGRLQTKQDTEKVMAGLRSNTSMSDLESRELHEIVANLNKRVFLVRNVHEPAPEVFHTRWCLSYLRGPLTSTQIKDLMSEHKKSVKEKTSGVKIAVEKTKPSLPPQIDEYYLPVLGFAEENAKLIYKPQLFGLASTGFYDKSLQIDHSQELAYLTNLTEGAIKVDWKDGAMVRITGDHLKDSPEENAEFAALPRKATQLKSYAEWENDYSDFIYSECKLDIWKSTTLDITSKPGESERDFRIRIAQTAREQRDDKVERLRRRYAGKIATLQDRMMRAEQKLEKERTDYRQQSIQTAISVGTTLLGAFLGRKTISKSTISKASTAVNRSLKAAKEKEDIANARETVETLRDRLQKLEDELAHEIKGIEEQTDPMRQTLEKIVIKPRKSDIKVHLVSLVWTPHWQLSDGTLKPCFQ